MNDMTAILLLIACVYVLYKTWSRSSAFKNGLDYANKILDGSDEEKALARSVAEKNAQHGGNWYFCRINKKYRNREQ